MNTLFKYRETVCSNKEKQFVFIKGNTLFAIGKRSFISRAYKEKALQINDSQSLIEYSKRDLNPHSRNGQRILSPSCLPFHHSSILKGKRERKTRLELATLTLARLCSTNWAISAIADAKVDIFLKPANIPQTFFTQKSVHFRQAYKQTFDYQLIRPR